MLRILQKRFALTFFFAPILIVAGVLPQSASADFVQQGPKLVGMNATGSSYQGTSVAISADGNTAIVGAAYDASEAGATWVFVRSNGVWAQQSKLVGAGAVGTAQQGISVALSADGNTALIGGWKDNAGVGAAWVFVRSSGVWSPQGGKLVGSGRVGASGQGIGVALSADGNTALIGGTNDNSSAGAAWAFTRNAGTWSPQGPKMVGSGAVGAANQGSAVALSGDGNTALIGATSDNSGLGAAWVYVRSAGTWSQFGSKLVGSGAVGTARQGYSVALSADGKTAAVGGYGDADFKGAAWVFAFNGSTWGQQGAKLAGAQSFGATQGSVSLSGDGDTLLSGGDYYGGLAGGVWVFSRKNAVWSEFGKLFGTQSVGEAHQGSSTALSADGSTAIIGGYGDNSNVGASWVWLRRPAHDFSGDTNSDILWRNTSGEAGMWLMNGGVISLAPSLGVVPGSWSIVGQRDFNGDGKSDLLWRNTSGDTGIWFMNGGTTLSTAGIGNIPSNWSVVGTGDFNGDGKADILWRNTVGDVWIWFMNGGTALSIVPLGNVPTNWSVNGTADFNGDGKADILWRNTSHDVGLWLMNGGAIVSAPALGNVGPTWSVVGLGDFDGNGKGDILWRNTSGETGMWLMNGSSIASAPSLGNVGASWNVASVGDYNGDGKADILWRSTSHDIGIWFMNGGTLASTAGLGNVGPTWIVQNAASN